MLHLDPSLLLVVFAFVYDVVRTRSEIRRIVERAGDDECAVPVGRRVFEFAIARLLHPSPLFLSLMGASGDLLMQAYRFSDASRIAAIVIGTIGCGRGMLALSRRGDAASAFAVGVGLQSAARLLNMIFLQIWYWQWQLGR